GVWRYHPVTREFELFAEGGGNTWGLDFDRFGNLFAGGNTVEPLVHHVQGAYYVKGFGKHGPLHNPHSYGYFPPVKHFGYLGDSLTGGFVLYQGGAFPKEFDGACIAPNTRHSASRWSTLETVGSTFATRAAGDFITTSDIWFRPVDSTVGPDGALYVADWYDYNISHSNPQNRSKWYMPSRADGRVWRVAPAGLQPVQSGAIDLAQCSGDELVELLSHPNDWYARQARRILAERRDLSLLPRLEKLLLTAENQRLALQALWSVYVIGGLDDPLAAKLLDSPHEYVRAWTVRLLGDSRAISPTVHPQLVQMARDEPSVVVRGQLACTAKRLPAEQAIPLVRHLLTHDEDAADLHVPLLVWWAIEDKAVTHPALVLDLVASPDAWRLPLVEQFIAERLARRYAAEGTQESFEACAKLLALAPGKAGTDRLLAGLVASLSGRRLVSVPGPLAAPLAKLLDERGHDPGVLQLALRLGHAEALDLAADLIHDRSSDDDSRVALVQTLGEIRAESTLDRLLESLDAGGTDQLVSALVAALGHFNDKRVAEALMAAYPTLGGEPRSRVVQLLCGRREWSARLVEAVRAGQIDPAVVSIDQVRQILDHGDGRIAELVGRQWGRVQPSTPAETEGRITAILQMLARAAGDAAAGAPVFEKSCATCHKLHGRGNTVGPDLVGAERLDREKLVRNLVDPSAVVRQEYIAHVAVTVDGRVLTGLLAEATPDTITLLDAKNERTVLRRDDVEELRESPLSLMPDRILDELTDQQIRDLVAYVQSQADPSPAAAAAGGAGAGQ
ncbi:MAG: HEAT repeat domain-containing protein, partial [Pirellulales bacterium]